MEQFPELYRVYRHYKGGLYEVITLANHSETKEALVIYKSLHFGTVYARPLKQWFEDVSMKHGSPVTPRFSLWKALPDEESNKLG